MLLSIELSRERRRHTAAHFRRAALLGRRGVAVVELCVARAAQVILAVPPSAAKLEHDFN